MMDATLRRMVAVEAHRRRTGHCPVLVHALGTGESFAIEPLAEGFRDAATGLTAHPLPEGMAVDGAAPIDIRHRGDVWFDGFVHGTGEAFSIRAGGGASVTLYDQRETEFFQYAVSHLPAPPGIVWIPRD